MFVARFSLVAMILARVGFQDGAVALTTLLCDWTERLKSRLLCKKSVFGWGGTPPHRSSRFHRPRHGAILLVRSVPSSYVDSASCVSGTGAGTTEGRDKQVR